MINSSGDPARDFVPASTLIPGMIFCFLKSSGIGVPLLDFCLKVSRKGYALVVDTKLFLEAREKSGRLEFNRVKNTVKAPARTCFDGPYGPHRASLETQMTMLQRKGTTE